MNEMVERGAIAACRKFYGTDWDATSAYRKQLCYGIAIAVIEAMFEPTDDMVAAANALDTVNKGVLITPTPHAAWEAMITAALNAPSLPPHD